MLALTATTGKIGGATVDALLAHKLVSPSELVVLTSSSAKSGDRLAYLTSLGVRIYQTNYEDGLGMENALRESGADRLFLVSTPAISMDFDDAELGKGREKHHFAAIDAARRAGVKHIYYTSLAFQDGSEAGVMKAHFRTEEYLKEMHAEQGLDYTIIRMGLYNESWPLYLGHYKIDSDGERRKEIVVAGDGPASWASISDLGLATAIVLASPPNRFAQHSFFLSQSTAVTLEAVCAMVDSSKTIKVVSRQEYVDHYTNQMGMDKRMLEWWVSTYASLSKGLCRILDPTLQDLLATMGKKPDGVESTIEAMMSAGKSG